MALVFFNLPVAGAWWWACPLKERSLLSAPMRRGSACPGQAPRKPGSEGGPQSSTASSHGL